MLASTERVVMDIRRMVTNRSGRARPQPLVSAYASLQKPAPAASTDPLWTVLPSHSTTTSIPLSFPLLNGDELPQQGAAVLVGYDERGAPYIVWWEN